MTNKEILQQILDRLARIEESLNYHIKRTDLAETRITFLEKTLWKWTGAITVIVALPAGVFAVVQILKALNLL